MSKLYFYKCSHFLLLSSLSIFFIHHFHSYTKILTMIPLIPTPVPRIPTMIPRIPIIPTLIPRIPTLIPHITSIPLILLPNSPFRLLQIAILFNQIICFFSINLTNNKLIPLFFLSKQT